MAKKKLNTRVVVLLIAVGALVILIGMAGIIYSRPKDPAALAKRAEVLRKAGDLTEAAKLYGQAAGLNKNPEYMLLQGQVLLEQMRTDARLGQTQRISLFGAARNRFVEALHQNPKYVEAQRQLTEMDRMIAQSNSDWVAFIRSADRLLELVPDDHAVLFQRASAKIELSNSRPDYVKPALDDLTKLVQMAPKQEEYWIALANYQVQRNQKDDGEKTFKKALKEIPNSFKLRIAYSDFLRRESRDPESLALLQDAVRLQPREAEGYLAMASYYQQKRNMPDMIKVLEKAQEVDLGDFRSYSLLARVYEMQAQPDKAEATLLKGLENIRKAVAEDPRYKLQQGSELMKYQAGVVVLNHQLCDLLLDRLDTGGKPEELKPRVLEALQKMKAIREDNPYALKIQGRLALGEGKLVEAEQLLRRAYDGFGSSFDVRTGQLLITLYRRLNQLGEAQRIIERYLDFNKDNPSALLSLARFQVDYRNYTEATRLLNIVIKQAPGDKEASNLLQMVEVLSGKRPAIPDSMTKINRQEASFFMARANQSWLEGDQGGAIKLALDVAKKDEGNIEALTRLIQWYRELAKNTPEGDPRRADFDKYAKQTLQYAQTLYKDNEQVYKQLMLIVETDPAKKKAMELELAQADTDPLRKALRLAEFYRRNANEKEFLKALEEAEKLSKEPHPYVVEWGFDYALSRQDWKSAEKYIKVAQATDMDKVGGKLFQARLAKAQKQYDEAIRLTKDALAIRPRFSDAHAFLGDLYRSAGQLDEAKQEYDLAYQQNPANARAIKGLISYHEMQDKFSEVTHWVEILYRLTPDDPEVAEKFLRVREDRDPPELLLRQRQAISQREPENMVNLYQMGHLCEQLGLLKDAEQVYRNMVEISRRKWSQAASNDKTNFALANIQSVRLLLDILGKTDRDSEARKLLADYISQDVDKVAAWMLYGEYLEKRGDLAQARNCYEKAVQVNPADLRSCVNLARFSAREGRWPAAAEQLKTYMAKAGDKAMPGSEDELIGYLIEAGNFKEAEDRVNKILSGKPDHVDMLTLKGLLLLRQGKLDQSKEALDRALYLDTANANALMYRAQVHRAKGDKSAAIADLQAARRTNAPLAVSLQLVAIYEDMEDFPNAYAVLSSLLAEHPNYDPALQAMIGLCQRHQRWQQMDEWVQRGRKLHPRDPFYILAQAEGYRQQNMIAQAINLLSSAKKAITDSGRISLSLMQALVTARQYDEALAIGQEIRTREDVGTLAMAVGGRALVLKKQAAAGEAEFLAALKAAKTPREVLEVVGEIQAAYPPETALANLQKWLSVRPDDWQVRLFLAGSLTMQKHYDEALALLESISKQVTDDNDKFRLYRQMGLTYQQMNKYKEAADIYQKALAIQPKDGVALNNMAWMLAQNMGKPKEALVYSQKSVDSAPNNANAWDTHGVVLTALQDFTKAVEVLSRSIDLQDMPANRLHLGIVYEKMGRKADALRQYQRAWELIKNRPEDEDYQKIKDALKRMGADTGR